MWCEYCGKKNHACDECWTKQADEKKARAAAKKQGEDPGKGKGKSDGKGEGKGNGKGKGNGEKSGKGESGKGQPRLTQPPANAISLPESAEGEEGTSNRKRRRVFKLQKDLTNMAKSCGLALTMDAKPLPLQDKYGGGSLGKGYLLPVEVTEASAIECSLDMGAVERRPMVPPGVAPVTNRKRLRA